MNNKPLQPAASPGSPPGGWNRHVSRSAMEIWKDTGKEVILRIHGSSMDPLITREDSVVLKPAGADGLTAGDVFAFWEGECLVAHRVIRRKKIHDRWWFCEKGDNVAGWRWIPDEAVAGKVVTILKPHGAIDLTRKPWSLFNRGWSCAASCCLILQETALHAPRKLSARSVFRHVGRAGDVLLRSCLHLAARLVLRRQPI